MAFNTILKVGMTVNIFPNGNKKSNETYNEIKLKTESIK